MAVRISYEITMHAQSLRPVRVGLDRERQASSKRAETTAPDRIGESCPTPLLAGRPAFGDEKGSFSDSLVVFTIGTFERHKKAECLSWKKGLMGNRHESNGMRLDIIQPIYVSRNLRTQGLSCPAS